MLPDFVDSLSNDSRFRFSTGPVLIHFSNFWGMREASQIPMPAGNTTNSNYGSHADHEASSQDELFGVLSGEFCLRTSPGLPPPPPLPCQTQAISSLKKGTFLAVGAGEGFVCESPL